MTPAPTVNQYPEQPHKPEQHHYPDHHHHQPRVTEGTEITSTTTATMHPGLTGQSHVSSLLGDNPTIWVFGYGSLLWKPDFSYKSKHIGYIDGYVRRFYQGNETFRGKPGHPGRVANLMQQSGSQAWGVAYEISGRDEVASVLQALYTRETACGGYTTLVTTFYPREQHSTHPHHQHHPQHHHQQQEEHQHHHNCLDVTPGAVMLEGNAPDSPEWNHLSKTGDMGKSTPRVSPVQVLVYTVTPDNELYLGPDDVTSMARQIVTASGSAGSNVEYVTKIADFVQKFIPEDDDVYLFTLVAKIKEEVYKTPAMTFTSHHIDFLGFIPEHSAREQESTLVEAVKGS